MNTFVFVWIYAGLRACLFLSLFTCRPIFISLSRHNMLTLLCNKNWPKPLVLLYFGNQTFFMFPECIKYPQFWAGSTRTKNVDPDQPASSWALWSGSALLSVLSHCTVLKKTGFHLLEGQLLVKIEIPGYSFQVKRQILALRLASISQTRRWCITPTDFKIPAWRFLQGWSGSTLFAKATRKCTDYCLPFRSFRCN